MCSQCKAAVYCSEECQRSAWFLHSNWCSLADATRRHAEAPVLEALLRFVLLRRARGVSGRPGNSGRRSNDFMLREAEERAARMQRDAQLLLEQEQRQMRNDLQRETVDLAALRAEEILQSAITQADHERLADEVLKELENQKFNTAGGVS